eukprot:gnl/MRDRNA2_/MRDRNA2_34063_c0_seq1.p1 gnl/MRDRNA2_/MRDRNA2_34063_c0~~gnl/MRDRNA2_/MRDRNA2_34063_c0_seq1.p1  ORF type:complete len:814 (+),score=135.34 gnl/MRDRNA2_/MRDRNA2_34063_c0_seq1:87-2528(+)
MSMLNSLLNPCQKPHQVYACSGSAQRALQDAGVVSQSSAWEHSKNDERPRKCGEVGAHKACVLRRSWATTRQTLVDNIMTTHPSYEAASSNKKQQVENSSSKMLSGPVPPSEKQTCGRRRSCPPIDQRRTFDAAEEGSRNRRGMSAGGLRSSFQHDERSSACKEKLPSLIDAPDVKSQACRERRSSGNRALDRLMEWQDKQISRGESSTTISTTVAGAPVPDDESFRCPSFGSTFSWQSPSESGDKGECTTLHNPSFEVISPARNQHLRPLSSPRADFLTPCLSSPSQISSWEAALLPELVPPTEGCRTFGKDLPFTEPLLSHQVDLKSDPIPTNTPDLALEHQPPLQILLIDDADVAHEKNQKDDDEEEQLSSLGSLDEDSDAEDDKKPQVVKGDQKDDFTKDEIQLAMLIGDIEVFEKRVEYGESITEKLEEMRATQAQLQAKGVKPSPGVLLFRQVDWKLIGVAQKQELMQVMHALAFPLDEQGISLLVLEKLERAFDLYPGDDVSQEQWLLELRKYPELHKIISKMMNPITGKVHSLSEQMAELIGDVSDLELQNWRGEEGIGTQLLEKKQSLKQLMDSNVKPSPAVMAFRHMDCYRSNSVERSEVKHLLLSLKLKIATRTMPELDDVEGVMTLKEWLSIARNSPALQEALEEAVDDLSICRVCTYLSPPERMAVMKSEIKRLEKTCRQAVKLQETKDAVLELEEKGVKPSHGVLLFESLDEQGTGAVNRNDIHQVLKTFSNNQCGTVLHTRMLKKLHNPTKQLLDMQEWLAKLDSLPGLKYTLETNLSLVEYLWECTFYTSPLLGDEE